MTIELDPPGGVDDDDETRNIQRRAVLSRPLATDEIRPLSASVTVDVAAASRRGMARDSNDDHYLVVRTGRTQQTLATSLAPADLPGAFEEHGYAMLVADGLGEAGSGSVASRIALSTMAHMALEHGRWNVRVDPQTAMEIMDRAQQFYNHVDLEVFGRSMAAPVLAGMAASLTTTYSAGDSLFVAHVGHSRAYLYRNGILTQLTRDHTMASHLATCNRPISIERRGQDLQHILTDAIGAGGGTPPVDVEQFRLVTEDTVMLCTNGLTDVVDDGGIAEMLARPRQPAEQCAMLIQMAADRQSEDNVTVVIAQYRIPPA